MLDLPISVPPWAIASVWAIGTAILACFIAMRRDEDERMLGVYMAALWPFVAALVLLFLPIIVGSVIGSWIRKRKED